MFEVLRKIGSLFTQKMISESNDRATPSNLKTMDSHEEKIIAFIERFSKKIERISLPAEALKKVEGEKRAQLGQSDFYHGTKSNIETIRRNGFKGSRFQYRESTPLHLQISGSMVYFTQDHDYALDYALQDEKNVVKIRIPDDLKIYEVNFRILEVNVFLDILTTVQQILTDLHFEEITNELLLDYANLAFNFYLLHHGVDAILSKKQIAFIGTTKIPQIFTKLTNIS